MFIEYSWAAVKNLNSIECVIIILIDCVKQRFAVSFLWLILIGYVIFVDCIKLRFTEILFLWLSLLFSLQFIVIVYRHIASTILSELALSGEEPVVRSQGRA
jgi:hypothetical protein